MTTLLLSDLLPLLPEIFLACAGMVLLVIGVIRGNDSTNTLCWAVIVSFALAGIFLLGLDWDRTLALSGMFVMDRFAGFMKMLVIVGLCASLALAVRFVYQEHMARFEYPILVLFAGLGMMMMISANSLLSMYVGLELQSLSLYVLAAIRRDHIKSAEAGIKYFVLGALASGMLLFGISLIYGFTGSVSFETIRFTLDSLPTSSIAVTIWLVFILVGMAFKISAVPFHMWTPDVYEGAPTSVTALFAIVPKIAAMALLMRLLFEPFGSIIWQWQQIIWFLSVASMCVGAFAALVQDNIKRLMAYSSIGNMGYALIGIVTGSSDGAGAVVVYLTIYMVMTAGVFGVIMLMRRNGVAVEQISDLSGLSGNSPMLAYAMAVLMFSMSGIPPMAGFFGKLLIFEAAVAEGFFVLAVIGVLSSVVAAYYYVRIIKVMFFDEASDPFDKEMVFAKRAIVLLSVIFVLSFSIFPQTLVETSRNAAAVLFVG
jgi:NADH-quinone oxidoreductase subunit N